MKDLELVKIKEDIIEVALEDVLKNCKSETEKKIRREELKSKINLNTLITDTKSLGDYIKADDLNKLFGELYVDILTTFGVLNTMSDSASRYNELYINNISSIKSKVETIKAKLDSCRNTISHVQMPYFHLENFKTSDKFDTTRSNQKDRYGQYLPSKCYVRQQEEGGVSLPLVRRDNSLRYDNKVHTGQVNVNFQLGRGFIDNGADEENLENIIDEDNLSFWSDTILSDAPFEVSFKSSKPEKLYVNDGYFYGIESGALCELEINFESVNTINEIDLTPYAKYPINIIAIRYKLTDDQEEELTEIVFPENKEKILSSVTTKNKVSFKFPDILCKKIFIVFSQDHYTRETFVYKPSNVYKNKTWFESRNNKREKNINADYKAMYTDRDSQTALWSNINDRAISSNNDDIAEVILGDDKRTRKLIKYEYQYGFYNIGCFNNHFDRTGFYVSKKIQLKENIKSVAIKTDETHMKNSYGNHITDIEYYISCTENPGAADWIPIMPKNKDIIESELLFITAETRAYFRFQTDNVLSVMKNGEPITDDANEYHIDKDDRTGKFYCIQIFNYDFDAVYSVSYIPEFGHTVLDFSNKITTSIETFEADGSNSFTLSNNIYVEKDSEYCSIKLVDTSINSNSSEIELENKTDLNNQSNGFLNFDNSNKFQFYVDRNKIYFNKPIPRGCMIDISYKHLVNSIKTKAILRRNSTKDGWLTPIINSIEYNIETF